jgi:hypothetical protein
MQAGQGGSTAYAGPTVFFPFQKHCLTNSRTLQCRLSNGAKWNVKNSFQRGLLIEHVIFNFNISDLTATDNALVLPTEYVFLEQV